MKHTIATKGNDIVRNWHVLDAKGKILGRIATEVANKLMGKSKPYFVPNLDCGDHVVIVNAGKFRVTGKKESEKMYGNYSGFPGGLKEKPLRVMRAEKPTEPLRKAIFGMLPKNKLRDRMITRLYLFETEDHPYKAKFV